MIPAARGHLSTRIERNISRTLTAAAAFSPLIGQMLPDKRPIDPELRAATIVSHARIRCGPWAPGGSRGVAMVVTYEVSFPEIRSASRVSGTSASIKNNAILCRVVDSKLGLPDPGQEACSLLHSSTPRLRPLEEHPLGPGDIQS